MTNWYEIEILATTRCQARQAELAAFGLAPTFREVAALALIALAVRLAPTAGAQRLALAQR